MGTVSYERGTPVDHVPQRRTPGPTFHSPPYSFQNVISTRNVSSEDRHFRGSKLEWASEISDASIVFNLILRGRG